MAATTGGTRHPVVIIGGFGGLPAMRVLGHNQVSGCTRHRKKWVR
ncbi:MAG TPA: hypothetical protein VF711_05850 [Acidimicrobiales bacterium]